MLATLAGTFGETSNTLNQREKVIAFSAAQAMVSPRIRPSRLTLPLMLAESVWDLIIHQLAILANRSQTREE